ncbi:MAG: S9 family peptidase [Acidobacteria bacterium]|nr:S9 family peptidase [Acidobacteriota bacterium]
MRIGVPVLFVFSLTAAKPPLTTETVFDWRVPSSPRISPDGRQVVYVLETADRFADTFYSNLWIAATAGTDHRPLTAGKHKDSYPRWSPDGTKLAYISTRTGKPQIFIRWMDTGVEARITDLETPPTALSWSPDGQSLAFLNRVPGKPEWSVPMPKPPSGAIWAEPAVAVTRLKWRADGVAGIGHRPLGFTHVFVVPAMGGTPRQVTDGDFEHGGEPSWTPGGNAIVVHAARSDDADTTLYPDDIWRFSLDGEKPVRLTRENGTEQNPAVSPDGKLIAFTGFADKGNANHNQNLYVVNADGTGLRQLGKELDRNIVAPNWDERSRSLFAVVESEGRAHLYRIPIDGPAVAVTTGNARYATAYGSSGADAFSVSRNEQVAIPVSSPEEPKDIVTFAVDQPRAARRLTNANAGLLAARAMGKVEEIRWKSFDGKPMQGWLVFPPGFDANRKYPLFLDIHGGPHQMYGVEFTHQMHVFAGRGFVVFYSNPRGSTGYGEEFGNVIHAKYPGDDFKDLMTGVDAVIAKGFIDPGKLFVTGGSGGGLLTAWTVTQTNRFAAAVSQYPVTNWITQTGSSDIGLTMMRWLKATPWDNPQQYIDRSPLFQAHKVTTPTMVLTGEEDWRTPIGQSEEFYFALKARKVDTVLVRIPKEPHGIRGGYPSHRIAKLEHILGWFERYLSSGKK